MALRKISLAILFVVFLVYTAAPAQENQRSQPATPTATQQKPEAAPPQRRHFRPPTPSNLRVLPPFISPEELMETMKKFAGSLGVRCNYCHVGEEGKPLDTYDFASDAKPAKQNARVMMEMVRQINKDSLPRLKMDDRPEPVTCFTCHRGKLHPESELPMPQPPAAAKPGL